VRRYLEGQLGLRAPERTTEEFLYETSRDHALSAEHRELLAAFLQESDLVKFARLRPGEQDKQRAWAAAERFVRETGLVAANPIRGAAGGSREEALRLQEQ
jgi:predicted TIM-barrel fold metal-dependent hydrolase